MIEKDSSKNVFIKNEKNEKEKKKGDESRKFKSFKKANQYIFDKYKIDKLSLHFLIVNNLKRNPWAPLPLWASPRIPQL